MPLKKSSTTRKLIAFAFFAFFLSSLSFAAWSFYQFIQYIFTEHQQYGSISVRPYGYSRNNFLSHQWDSIAISSESFSLKLKNTHLNFYDLLSHRRHAYLAVKQLNFQVHPSKDSSAFSLDSITIPHFSLAFPIFIQIDSSDITLDTLYWNIQNIELTNTSKQNIHIQSPYLHGSFLQHSLSLEASLILNEKESLLSLNLNNVNDFLNINLQTNPLIIKEYNLDIDAKIQNPKAWLPTHLIPQSIPSITNLKLHTKLKHNDSNKIPLYEAKIFFDTDEIWPLKALNHEISVSGSHKELKANVSSKNDEGGKIFLNGHLNSDLDFSLSGSVQDMSAEFGPQMMPMDLKINSIIKKKDSVFIDVETRMGSKINATVLDFPSKPRIDFLANITHIEPWALDWSEGQLLLEKDFLIRGFYEDEKLHASTTIESVPYAYAMKADSVKTNLILNSKGISFSDIEIHTPKELYTGSGEVMWHDSLPHTAWELKQGQKGSASAWIDIEDSIKVDLKINNIETSTIPLAKPSTLEKIKGEATGEWSYNASSNKSKAQGSIKIFLDRFLLEGDFDLTQNKDTIFISEAVIQHKNNKIKGDLAFIISDPSTAKTHPLPIEILKTSISSDNFNIPVLLEPLEKNIFETAFFNGYMNYEKESGLQGDVSFKNITFNSIPSKILQIKKVTLSAEKESAKLDADLLIGNGAWDGQAELTLNDIFKSEKHLKLSHHAKNGGDFSVEALINKELDIIGDAQFEGFWFLPYNAGEITETDLGIHFSSNLKKGLHDLNAQFKTNSTHYKPLSFNINIPISLHGSLENNQLHIENIKTENNLNEKIQGSALFNLDSNQLKDIHFYTPQYSLKYDSIHWIQVKNLSVGVTNHQETVSIHSNSFDLNYILNSPKMGELRLNSIGNVIFEIPHHQEQIIDNTSIEANLSINKAVYKQNFDIDISPMHLDRYLEAIKKYFQELRKPKIEKSSVSGSRPTNLRIRLSDSQQDSMMVLTNTIHFPFTTDLLIIGNTHHPILSGDITNSGNGFFGIEDLFEFELNTFRIEWQNVPWDQGVFDIVNIQELPYCSNTSNQQDETCPVHLTIKGNIANPQIIPESSCGGESTSAAVYYNIFAGCIADENTSNVTNWNKLVSKFFGKTISSEFNKRLGGDYIGNIDMKVNIFNSNENLEQDTSYVRIPISLDQWIKNLNLVVGYTQDQSVNPTYENSKEIGLNYTFTLPEDTLYVNDDHLNPQLTASTSLVDKTYLSNTETSNSTSRLEKNIGFTYRYGFWSPCVLGFGKCQETHDPNRKGEK